MEAAGDDEKELAAQMAAEFLNEDLSEQQFGAPKAGPGMWASIVRMLDPIKVKRCCGNVDNRIVLLVKSLFVLRCMESMICISLVEIIVSVTCRVSYLKGFAICHSLHVRYSKIPILRFRTLIFLSTFFSPSNIVSVMFLSRVKQLTRCGWNRTNPLSGLCLYSVSDVFFSVR